ncbi:MAG TPA: 1-deoxy-D-xylulose-5-phosphate synthase [Burkholderiales bacterium]|nr:1-deoxy-D-xylulose-5-phosphate synthase [Burkholderiales bacterium]
MYPLLDTIQYPQQLRALEKSQLRRLADELRQFLLESVSQTGGHLSSNLGTVELTIALHYVFDTPNDRIVWDVGHQTYGHKVLTGRRKGMQKLRMWGGISGFPRREESEYDTFGTAHSSTSISAALGMAVASRLKGEKRRAVAVIGDGAMTAGMAFEALNNAGDMDVDLLVILNDNDMSISPPVGALNKYLARLMSGQVYNKALGLGERVLGQLARRAEEHMKGMVTPGTMFEEFGFNYIGPIDGHDLDALLPTLYNIRQLRGPQFLHVVTRKGQGYKLAEVDPVLYHGVSKFDQANGIVGGKAGGKQTYTQIFGDWICDMAAADPRLVGITPAMREGSGLVDFAARFPDRYFDVGIAEQHALTFAAGVACEGCKPVVAIYSTFLQRAYDQLIHDVQIQNLPMVFAIDRAGLVGADGATHHGSFDLTYLRCLPNMTVMTPSDENECRQMLYTAYQMNGPVAVRYPRGTGPGVPVQHEMQALAVGKGEVKRKAQNAQGPHRVAILAFGSMVHPSLKAAESLDATVANMRFVKPLDEALVLELAADHALLVTVEENVIAGGAGSAVLETLERHGVDVRVLQLGLPDRFIDQGDPGIQLAECGLTAEGILRSIRARFAGSTVSGSRAAPILSGEQS